MEVRSEVTFLVHMLDFILWQWLDLCQIKQTGFYKMKEIQTWNWQLSILDKKKKYSSPKTFEILKDNLENVFEFLLFLKLSLSLSFTLILFSFFHSFLSLSFSQSLFLSLSHFSSLFSSVFFSLFYSSQNHLMTKKSECSNFFISISFLKTHRSIRDFGLPVFFSQSFTILTLSGDPCNSPITVPRLVFCTQPTQPLFLAISWRCLRNNTPCTLP